MRVKICGITNLEDAFFAINAGADALGFVFYEKSPRFITPSACKEIIDKLPPFVEKVGLFVNHSAAFVNSTVHKCGLTLAQIHFEADKSFFRDLECNAIAVVRAKEQSDVAKYANSYRLVDAFVPGFGGEGKRVPLEWFASRDNSKIILAGGLSYENLEEIKNLGFYGVDVSSSVEISKGKKSREKIEKFVKKAKEL